MEKPVELTGPKPTGGDDLEQISRVWNERAAQMARVEAAPDNQADQVTVILVRMGRELMALDVQYVVNIRPCGSITRVPRVPGWVAGVTNLRGNILPVIHLWKYFGLPGEPVVRGRENESLLVILRAQVKSSRTADQPGSTEIVFLVDDVVGVETLTLGHGAAEGGLIHRLKPEYIQAVGERIEHKAGGDPDQVQRHVAILNVEALLKDPRLTIHDEVV